jgi:hypothetical protein
MSNYGQQHSAAQGATCRRRLRFRAQGRKGMHLQRRHPRLQWTFTSVSRLPSFVTNGLKRMALLLMIAYQHIPCCHPRR